jgi:hypothetical protein
MQVLVGRDESGGDLGPAQKLAVIGSDEIGPDPAGDVGAAIGVALRDADPFDGGVPRRDLTAEQPDPAGPHDGQSDALRLLLHCLPPVASTATAGGMTGSRR